MDRVIKVFRDYPSLACLVGLGFVAAMSLLSWSYFNGQPQEQQRPMPISYRVSFQGYSNAANGERWAIFLLTNCGLDTLYLGHCAIVLANGSSNEWRDMPGLFPIAILPRSSTNFAVKIPPEAKCWSVVCDLQPVGLHDKLYDFLRMRGIPHYLIPVRCPRGPDALSTEWIRE